MENIESGASYHSPIMTTDSMVTVPLSDVRLSPQEADHDSRAFDLPNAFDEVASVEDETSEPPLDIRERRPSAASRSAQGSSERDSTSDSDSVDWEKLARTEEQEPRTGPTDESTALLLARLEQENNALVTNPKSGLSGPARPRSQSRPPSIQHIKKLINDPRPSLRYSQLPAPPMTELEFWAALVADYPLTAQRLPTLTTNKIRAGVPPPLRGVVWPSIAGARDTHLLEEFQRLGGETSPYEGIIEKDIGRSFPNVEMFRDPNGDGQQMLARVLKCFSLYDSKIGYCQGLGFVVGPLLMHMSDTEAFCILVRLMEYYDLRSCFLPDLSGLHLRIYQFQSLLSRHFPELFAHLESLNIEPLYVSQWFLSFFAVTCPLPMLLRIYDVLLLEGACETLMRVALSLMRRNEEKIMACMEFEDAMQLLLSRSLWDTYACHADDLVNDFVSLTSLVTKESLQALEASYTPSQGGIMGFSFPQMQTTASRFLGRLWAGPNSNSHIPCKSLTLNPTTSRASGTVRRSPSKQSMASTLNSFESTSEASTAPTEMSVASSVGSDPQKPHDKPTISHSKDKDLHGQIEDLLMALRELQREQADLARELQSEREKREEDYRLAKSMLCFVKEANSDVLPEELLSKAEERFSAASKRISIIQTKHQLRDDVNQWKEKHGVEAARCMDLGRRIDDHEKEKAHIREELREARNRIQDSHREKQKLERTIQELRARKATPSENPRECPNCSTVESTETWPLPGLREIKLVNRAGPQRTNFPKRTSSLGLQSVLPTDHQATVPEDSLLLELVHSKTAEAVARQELEEVKAKLDSLRRLVSNSSSSPPRSCSSTESSSVMSPLPSLAGNAARSSPEQTTKPSSPAPSVGFFSGWTKRNVSISSATFIESK